MVHRYVKEEKGTLLGFWSIWIGNCPQKSEIQGLDYDIGATGFLRVSLVLWDSNKDHRSVSYGALYIEHHRQDSLGDYHIIKLYVPLV